MGEDQISLKQRIQQMAGEEDTIEPQEFSNLILDDMHISEITAEDKTYLNTFENLANLSMNHTGLRSLDNLPAKCKMERVSTFTRLIQI